ncbi:MAG: HAD hydrolase-like protein [Clostridia bacterium]
MKYKNLFFDLDGTLSNSYKGIALALDQMFAKFNLSIPKSEYHNYIGPPLITSFGMHFKGQQLDDAIACFREYYHTKGCYVNELYDGMEQTLKVLKQRGYKLFVGTTKKESVAIMVIKFLNIFDYFDDIFGADDLLRPEKEQVLEYGLQKCNLKATESLMIGDTMYDLLGAKKTNMDCMLCAYGFGDVQELMQYNPKFVVDSPLDILNVLD